jgi:putative flippase GtrA
MEKGQSYPQKELFRFIVTGCSAVSVDLGVYALLDAILSTNSAKGISFVCGTLLAFLLNKYWTFGVKEKSYKEAGKFILLYSFSLVANVTINKIVLSIFPKATLFAFLCATGTSTVLNFIGQKFWVFKGK